MKKEKGFTLIEVLTVIMIIAILASVILVSLDVARERTRDTVIMNQIGQLRALAEGCYTIPEGYEEIANDAALYSKVTKKIAEMGGELTVNFSSEADNYKAYCAYSPLIRDDTKAFCVDSTGNAVEGDSSSIIESCVVANPICETEVGGVPCPNGDSDCPFDYPDCGLDGFCH